MCFFLLNLSLVAKIAVPVEILANMRFSGLNTLKQRKSVSGLEGFQMGRPEIVFFVCYCVARYPLLFAPPPPPPPLTKIFIPPYFLISPSSGAKTTAFAPGEGETREKGGRMEGRKAA